MTDGMPAAPRPAEAELLQAIAALRVWRKGDAVAPHKPLLVLLALARVREGRPRLAPFTEFEEPLRQLIEVVMPERRGHPEYPFWRLQHDRIWEVTDAEDLPRRRSSTDVAVTALRNDVRGGFLPMFQSALEADPLLVDEAAGIAARHLPAHCRAEVLETLGWAGEEVRVRRQAGIRFAPVENVSQEPVVAHPPERVATWNRIEARLLADWIAWCAESGRTVTRPLIPTDEGTTIRADGFDRTTALLVEAKGSSSREHVRMAIGQVLDYSSLLSELPHRRAVLVPSRPAASLERLMAGLHIGVVFRDADGFTELLVD